MKNNPFLLSGHASPKYFCNRDLERVRIENSLINLRSLTPVSKKRMGKTTYKPSLQLTFFPYLCIP